jgi:8-oxo-dGTP pyrophosphatase MutT (NUDIX family)
MPELVDTPESWPVVDSSYLHRDGWVVALRADRVQRPGHPEEEPFRRVVMEHPGAAVVLALDAQDRALVLWQYRHACQQVFVELVAGLIDGMGEDPIDVARRELAEEAGLAATEWTHLVSTYASPGISAELAHIYLARGLSEVGRGDFLLQHEEAEMVTGWVPFDELERAVLDGKVRDAPLLIAVLAARARGLIGVPARG